MNSGQQNSSNQHTNDQMASYMTQEEIFELQASKDQVALYVTPTPEGEYDYDQDGYVKVFINGSCLSNGLPNAQAGLGIWFRENSSLNVSESAPGRQTNNNAEIQSAILAILKANSAGIRKLRIYTNSMYLINSMTEWLPNWKENGWKNSRNKPVENKFTLMILEIVISILDAVDWKHIREPDEIANNERADSLAKQGARN